MSFIVHCFVSPGTMGGWVTWKLTKRVACVTQAVRSAGSVRMKGTRYEGGREEEKPGRMTGDGFPVYVWGCVRQQGLR